MKIFNFFDIFKDVEIDLTNLLKDSSNNYYIETFSNFQPIKITLKSLFEKINISDLYKNNITFFKEYNINEYETPFTISYKIFNKIDYWWLICLLNNIEDLEVDWVLEDEILDDISSYLEENIGFYPKEVYYKFLFNENEMKRKIIIPLPRYVEKIIWEIKEKILAF